MKKRLRSTHRLQEELMAEINVTPFVDILLVLLIVFMISAPLLTHSLSLQLPQGHLKDVERQPPVRPVIVSVDQKRTIAFNKQRFTFSQLTTYLRQSESLRRDTPVYLQLDRRLSHGFLIHLMLLFKNEGFRQVGLVFQEDSE